MSQVFISYARSTEAQAQMLAKALRAEGFDIWFDDALPAHRNYSDVIEERLKEAQAVVVIWSEDAVRSQWVRAEADFARTSNKLVQLSIDGALPPMPFNQIHCAQLQGWEGNFDASGWHNVMDGIHDLIAGAPMAASSLLATQPAKPSIAVLPFSNLSRDPEQEYFVLGMMDEIVTALTRIRTLRVISSESSLSIRELGLDNDQAAERMGVRYLLQGSVRWSGANVRIAVKLIDSRHGEQIWADHFDDTLVNVFELQDRIALKVYSAIEPSVHEAEVRRVSRQPIENLGCYDLYLRAAPLRTACRKPEVWHALKLLTRAIALDPDFAPALAQAAGCHSQIYCNSWDDDIEPHKAQGLVLAERAMRTGSEDASVLAQVANALMDLDDGPERATALADRAITLNPGCARAWFVRGVLGLVACDGTVAVEKLEQAAILDPISPLNDIIKAHIAIGLCFQRRLEEALQLFLTTTHRTPRIHLALASLHGHLGSPNEGRAELDKFRSMTTSSIDDMNKGVAPDSEIRSYYLEGIRRALEDG